MGYKITLSGLEGGRIGIASQSVGAARAAFESALTYAKDRRTFGKPIFSNIKRVQFRLAEMATQIEAAPIDLARRQHERRWQAMLEGSSDGEIIRLEMARKSVSDAIQIHGGYGYVSDFPVERIYRDVRVCQIYEGSSDIQKILIRLRFDGLSFVVDLIDI